MLPVHRLCLVVLLAAWCPPVAVAQSPEEGAISACLLDAAASGQPGFVCMGREYSGCLKDIGDAGGNLGTRAGTTCAQAELSAWLDAWALALESALWTEEDRQAVLARFAAIQAKTAGACLKDFGEVGVPMIVVSECFGISYGPFLVEELRSSK